MKYFILLLALLALSPFAYPSDHIDGPVTTKNRQTDLTDLYAFPTPEKTGFLTIVLNAYVAVPKSGHFDSKVSYTIHLRPARISNDNNQSGLKVDSESGTDIQCTFVTPRTHEAHTATCSFSNGNSITTNFNSQNNANSNLLLFAGMRSDPFFLSTKYSKELRKTSKIPTPKSSDDMSHLNVLSVVLEFNLKKAGVDYSLIGISAESFAQNDAASPKRRMDYVGRPEVTNVSMFTPAGAAELRDLYNTESHRGFRASALDAYKKRLMDNFAFYDAIDGKTDLPDPLRERLVDIVLNDFLVVDLSKPCTSDSYLEIEKAILKNHGHKTCGGRSLNADIMDTMHSLFVGGTDGPRLRDGIDGPSRPVSNTFPYLVDPDLSLQAQLKAKTASILLLFN